MRTKFLSALLAVALLLTVFLPVSAAGGKVSVLLQNRSGAPTRISLSGPETVSFDLPTKSLKVQLLPGTYSYSYYACEKSFTGKLKVKRENTLLTIWPCTSQKTDVGTKSVSWTIVNKTGGSLSFLFVGPETYRFSVPPGKVTMNLAPGKYFWDLTASGACKSFKKDSGKLTVKVGYYWTWYCVDDEDNN